MSNFLSYVQHMFPGGAESFVGGLRPFAPPGYGPAFTILMCFTEYYFQFLLFY